MVEANHFEMGAARPKSFSKDHVNFNPGDDDHPIHPVILTRPFYIATTEVTVDQFRRFVESTGYRTTAETDGHGMVIWDPMDDPRRERVVSTFRESADSNWQSPGISQAGSHPVVGVSYHDAKAYCDWLSEKEGRTYRLPTEAEWECACRAGTTTYFSFGDDYRERIDEFANLGHAELERTAIGRVSLQWIVDFENDAGDGHVFTAPVSSFQPNPWGLFDMHGNVWEWCEDRYLDTYYKRFVRDGHRQVRRRAIDPVCREPWNEHGDWRVIRGGSWFVSPIQCRSGVRGVFEADDAACYVGFRVVRDADEDLIRESQRRHRRSEQALLAIKPLARAVMEDRNGHLRFDFTCQSLSDDLLERLAELQYSIEIHVSPPGKLSGAQIKKLCQPKRLSGLVIAVSGPELSADDFSPLADHPEMELLQITGTTDLSDQVLDYLNRADRLTSLQLQGSRITDRGLMRLPMLDQVQTLHLSSTQSEGGVLQRLTGSPLREVSFGKLNDAGARQLVAFPSLRRLNLRGCPITAQGITSIASLRLLESLQLPECEQLRDLDFQPLAALTQLSSLDLTGTDAGDQAVTAVSSCNRLRDFYLGSTSLTDDGLNTLSEIVSLRSLSLTEETTNVSDAGLVNFWRLTNLEGLSLAGPAITGSGLGFLAELPKLRRLSLSLQEIHDQAIEHIVRCESLVELNLGNWRHGGLHGLSDEDLLKLADLPKLQKLSLYREGTTVSADAVEQLRKLKPGLKTDVH